MYHVLQPQAFTNSAQQFRVMTYNVLAETYAIGYSRYKYAKVPDNVIDWQYRFGVLKEHFTKSDADIICLQEIEEPSFKNEFSTFFKELGYSGIMQEKKTIGNAIFYRDSKFKLRFTNSRSRVLLAAFTPLNSSEQEHEKNDTVAPLYICNAHLDGNPQKPHERFNQIKSLFAQLKKEETQGNFSIKEAIICGDFNCDHKSGIYELLTSGALSKDFRNPVTHDLPYTKEDFEIEANTGISLEFKSAYASLNNSSEPEFTFAAPNMRRDPLDFIFFTPATLKVLAVSDPMLMINKNQVENEGIPNDLIPSDHLPMAAVFEFVAQEKQQEKK